MDQVLYEGRFFAYFVYQNCENYMLGIKWLSGCSEVGDHKRGGSKSPHFTGQLAD